MAQLEKAKNCTCNSYIFQLPLAFDESLSYLEQVCYILKKLNETIEQVNKNTEVLENIDVNFTKIYEDITKMQQEIENFEIQIENEIESRFNSMYQQVISLMNDYQASFNLRLDTAVDELNARIDRIELGDIYAYNPTTGRVENINKVLTDIYDSVRYDALTCTEFESLDLTATEFDAVEITAFNFDNNGKSILTNI